MDVNAGQEASNGNVTSRFWPYSRRSAFKISLVLVPALVLALVVLHETGLLSEDSPTGWELLGATLVGLIPIFLTVLDGVAANAGSVEGPGGLKVTFAAIQSVDSAKASGITIAAIIGGSAVVDVADSGGRAVMEALRPVLGAETAVLRLGEGKEWWQTRLLLLSSGATRLGRPRVIVFTATESGKENQFIGWARPSELLRVQLSNADDKLLRAFQAGQARANRWALGTPQPGEDTIQLPWAQPGNSTAAIEYPPALPIAEMIPEQLLLIALSHIEPGDPDPFRDPLPGLSMTGEFVKQQFGTVLRRDSLDRTASDDEWRETILRTSEDYCAVTDGGAFVMLFTRQAATTAMLRSLVKS